MKLVHALSALLCLPLAASEWRENPAIGKAFTEAGVTGTFVVYDEDADRFTGHGERRARTRFVPASTFKIANSLIGLETGSVESVDEVLPYGGGPQPFEIWEHDMSLREAIPISNVPIYQELARRTGLERMKREVRRLEYGNGAIGKVVDRFWLDGPLAISAVEQVRFQQRLADGRLPYSGEIQADVRGILELESGSDWTLYGKTGWADAPDPGVGWWVGWVANGTGNHPFALNLDVRSAEDAEKRVPLGKRILAELELIGKSGEGQDD